MALSRWRSDPHLDAALLELVARTIFLHEDGLGAEDSEDRANALGPDDGQRRTWERAPEWERDDYRAAARAAFEVLKRATKE